MGRHAEGWKPWPCRGIVYVRFTHKGERYTLSTGERDPSKAHRECARIYAEVVSGRYRPRERRHSGTVTPLADLFSMWLEALESTHDKRTVASYGDYVKKHFLPTFESFDHITTASGADYVRARLKRVLAKTVRKELSALRNFLSWSVEQKVIAEEDCPVIGPVRKGAVGVRAGKQRSHYVEMSPEDVEALLAKFPETGGRGKNRFPVRARFVVAYDTGLRPETLNELRVPENYQRGASVLVLYEENDKGRFARPLPLTARAREALDRVCPDVGLIFGAHDFRPQMLKAREAAKLAGKIAPYDLRHARATHLVEGTGNLPGVAYLLGHKHLTTTDKYAHANMRAAEAVLTQAEKPLKRTAKKGR